MADNHLVSLVFRQLRYSRFNVQPDNEQLKPQPNPPLIKR